MLYHITPQLLQNSVVRVRLRRRSSLCASSGSSSRARTQTTARETPCLLSWSTRQSARTLLCAGPSARRRCSSGCVGNASTRPIFLLPRLSISFLRACFTTDYVRAEEEDCSTPLSNCWSPEGQTLCIATASCPEKLGCIRTESVLSSAATQGSRWRQELHREAVLASRRPRLDHKAAIMYIVGF